MFKVKKIRNIDKKVCFAEQKIAYNYALSYRSILESAQKKAKTKIQFIEILQDTENMLVASCKEHGTDKKYNLDVIVICYRQGIEKYLKNFSILTSYEEIGKIFSFPYKIEV